MPGGIPARTTTCATINASTYGNGSSNAASGIQTALNSCPSGQTVLLSAGTFLINGTISIPSNVTLRGSGSTQTILNLKGSGSAAIQFGTVTNPSASTSNAITGGATKGSTSVTVSGSGITTGMLMMITQNNTSYMTESGSNGTCSWCNGGVGGDSGQVVSVTGVNGSTVTFSPALYMDYSPNSPVAYRFQPGAKSAGLESLQLYANNTGYNANIRMDGAEYSWVKGVESNFADGAHMLINYSLQNTVRDSYFHDGYSHTSGGTDDQVGLNYKSSGNLVENNIFYRQHVSLMLEWGASGNVIAYNYSTGNYHQDYLAWMINDFDFHGAHPMMNLFEGNVAVKFQPDSTWGSSSHSTLFRNWFLGSDQYVPPLNSRGPLQPQNAQQETANSFAYTIDYLSQYNNLVGDISGSSALLSSGATNMLVAPTSGGSNSACYRIGYNSDNDAAMSPNNAYSTMFIHGLYNCTTGAFQWNSGTTQTLPASFYLSSKPSWFGSAPWPLIGPDVTGGTGPNGHAYKNPAQLCFDNSSKDSNGMPIINPTTCYGQTTSASTIAPPSNLKAVAN